MKEPKTREEAIALIYTTAADEIARARESVALHAWCVKKFGDAPPLPEQTRRIAAMRDVEELLNDPVHGLRGSLGALTH